VITVLLLLLIVTPLAAMAFLQARTDWLWSGTCWRSSRHFMLRKPASSTPWP